MAKRSAGFLLFKREGDTVKVLLLHPGGPIWGHKDFWLLPKGGIEEDEDDLQAAYREFEEETGNPLPKGELIDLGEAKGDSKTNRIWAIEGDIDLSRFQSVTFTMEWPPKSGRMQEFPECDRAEWFDLTKAKQKLFKTQTVFIDRLAERLQSSS